MKHLQAIVAGTYCVFFWASTAHANAACEPFSDAAETLPLEFLDRADPLAARVTSGLEEALLLEHIQQTEAGPFQKHYCEMGIFEMVIRFVQPTLDDSIFAMVTEATYAWDAGQSPAGWVLAGMRRQPMCGRGPSTFAPFCS